MKIRSRRAHCVRCYLAARRPFRLLSEAPFYLANCERGPFYHRRARQPAAHLSSSPAPREALAWNSSGQNSSTSATDWPPAGA